MSTFAGAKVISSLPFSDTLDTTQATADQTDACSWPADVNSGGGSEHKRLVRVHTLDGRERQHRRQRVELFHRAGRRHRCAGASSTLFEVPVSSTSFVARAARPTTSSCPDFCGGTLKLSVTGVPEPATLDQSFTSPGGAVEIINEYCNFVAQTFTAGWTACRPA